MRQHLDDFKRRRLEQQREPAARAVLGAGCTVPLASLSDLDIKKAQSALTYYPTSTFSGETAAAAAPLPVLAYRAESDVLTVPRCYGARVFDADPSGLTDGVEMPQEVRFAGSLRERQVQAADASVAALEAYPHACMLVLPCGFGKTVVGLSIAARLRRKTLVIVHKEFLMEQWKERIRAFVPGARVGHIQGSRCDVVDRDIVVGMIASLTSPDKSLECLGTDFGLVILDEAHHMAARLFSTVFFRVKAKFVLGLTATPKRKDACTGLLHEHMGHFAFREEPDPGTALVLRVPYTSPMTCRKGEEVSPCEAQRIKTRMTLDRARNAMLVAWCLRAAKAGRKTLLLSDRVQHLKDLHESFVEAAALDDSARSSTSCLYIGGMKKAERESANGVDTLFGSYSLAQEGLDIPALDTLILATPAADITQAVGRILRQHEGKKNPVVVDFVDDHCRNFQRLNDIRLSAYKRRAFAVRDVASAADFQDLEQD